MLSSDGPLLQELGDLRVGQDVGAMSQERGRAEQHGKILPVELEGELGAGIDLGDGKRRVSSSCWLANDRRGTVNRPV